MALSERQMKYVKNLKVHLLRGDDVTYCKVENRRYIIRTTGHLGKVTCAKCVKEFSKPSVLQ